MVPQGGNIIDIDLKLAITFDHCHITFDHCHITFYHCHITFQFLDVKFELKYCRLNTFRWEFSGFLFDQIHLSNLTTLIKFVYFFQIRHCSNHFILYKDLMI